MQICDLSEWCLLLFLMKVCFYMNVEFLKDIDGMNMNNIDLK